MHLRGGSRPVPAGIVLCDLSTMTADLIGRITSGRPDMRVVADVRLRDAGRALSRTGARLLLVGLPDERVPRSLMPVMANHPDVTVLGLVAEGGRTYRHELRTHTVAAGELSAELLAGLLDAG